MYPQLPAKIPRALKHWHEYPSQPVQVVVGLGYMTRVTFTKPRPHPSAQGRRNSSQSHYYHTRASAKTKSFSPCSSPDLCLSELRKNSRLLPNTHRRWIAQNRTRQSQPHIAILGGGISGLSTAHYLTREIPNAKVTIYESSHRLGGWLHSQRVQVQDGDILLESGPRTLRFGNPESLSTAEIIQDLGIEDKIMINPHDSVAARNRYVYYPDHLVRMPGPGENVLAQILRILREPIYNGAFTALLEFTREPRDKCILDQSVGAFFSRRLGGSDLVDNIHSAIAHGIYAGDIYKLSMRSLFPLMWYLEKEFGGLARGMAMCSRKKIRLLTVSQMNLRKEVLPKLKSTFLDSLGQASVYSFKDGLSTLSKALEKKLEAMPNVQISLNDKAESIESSDSGIKVKSSKNELPVEYTHVVSSLLPHHTASLTKCLPTLASVPTVTVMVVNLYYRSPNLLPVHGFGYLIPKSIPYEQNPECALGVVFDSDAIQGQDTAPGTKLTVMLGGHWWDELTEYPSEEEGASMARAILKRHLAITADPDLIKVYLQKECIPQYTVGHQTRMGTALNEVSTFKGRLIVVGNGYQGIGVNDSIAAARRIVMQIKDHAPDVTGLEWVNEEFQQIVEY